MEGRPRFIPPTPEEEKAERDKKLDKHLEWVKNKTAQVQAKSSTVAPKVVEKETPAPRPPLEMDQQKKASGEDNEKELVMKNGEWVYKEYDNE